MNNHEVSSRLVSDERKHNKITLFANGIGDFQLLYEVSKEGREIFIPVRQDYLGDGINLAVFAETPEDDVEMIQSPRFVASNANLTALKLDDQDIFMSLLASLRGAMIKVVNTDGGIVEGRILGVDDFEEDNGDFKIQHRVFNVFTKDGLERIRVEHIKRYIFPQEEIQREINRALEASYAKIRPQSSIITMKLRSRKKDTCHAVVCFTVPVAIWSMEYQIRRVGEIYRLTGSAVVHNNTDQAWENAQLRCVTGIPYTGDLREMAEQRVPVRNRLNIINAKAIGGTEVHRGMEPASAGGSLKSFAAASAVHATEMTGDINYCKVSHFNGGPQAASAGADAGEVGDFTILQPRDSITVPANSSAVIEVIGTDLKECKSVLFYNHAQDEGRTGRPQMALQFVNILPHSLGRGPCNVYDGDLFQGTAIFPATKPKEKRFILHGQDTAVDVRREGGQVEQQYASVNIKKGILATVLRRRTAITYRVRSLKDEAAELIIDHDRIIQYAETRIDSETEPVETTTTGNRYVVKVPARSQTELKLTETYLEKSEVEFVGLGIESSIRWLRTNLIATQHPSVRDMKGFDKCLSVQTLLEAKDREIQQVNTTMQALNDHQKEIRANLAATKSASSHTNEWENQLAKNDTEIAKYRSTIIPKLRDEKDELETQLRNALGGLVLNWRE